MIRRLEVVSGGAGLAAFIVWSVLAIDVKNAGPWTRSFNYRLEATAKAAGLIGRPESDVEVVLGSASYVYVHAGGRTFNYWPLPGLPSKQFQVHCREGVVTGLELFDD
ncbi:MAG: hypothetical protein ACO1OB_07190 [Archangium sp.]